MKRIITSGMVVVLSVALIVALFSGAVAAKPTQELTHSAHNGDVWNVEANANNGEVYSVGDDGHIVGSYPNGSIKWENAVNMGNIRTITVNDTSGYIYTGNQTGWVYKVDPETGNVVDTHQLATNQVYGAEWYDDGGYGIFTDAGGYAKRVNSDMTREWNHALDGDVYAVGIEEDSGDSFVGYDDTSGNEYLRALGPQGGQIFEKALPNGQEPYGIEVHESSNTVVVATDFGTVIGYDAGNGSELWNVGPYNRTVKGNPLSIDDNAGVAYVTHDNRTVRGYDIQDGSSIGTFTPTSGDGYAIDVTDNRDRVAVGTNGPQVEAWTKFETAKTVSGTVTDKQNGTSIDNATVEAYQNGSFVKSTKTDSNGKYSLTLQQGTYTLETSKNGYETKSKEVVVDSTKTVDFALNGLYDIDGYVQENTKDGDPIQDANVEVFDNGTRVESAVTNNSGYYFIDDLGGGNYTFNVSALGYQDLSSNKTVDNNTQYNFRLDNKDDEYVPYMEFKTSAWIPSNDSRSYHVYFSDENGDYKEVTKDVNVTSLNVSRVKVNTTSLELGGQAGINATVNVTAEYTYKGTNYKQTNELVVAKLETAQLEILPASHRISAFLRDSNVQMIIVAIIVGTTAAYLTSNPFAGLGGIQLALMIAWSNDRLNTGILLVGFYYMLFAGMLGMQVRKQRH